ncbi:hypothetical protein BC629DRAFT_596318 [Irpex lacteus]|nr:hypothetical protein BC629DRAFT_596318 [Irpex lacteus]
MGFSTNFVVGPIQAVQSGIYDRLFVLGRLREVYGYLRNRRGERDCECGCIYSKVSTYVIDPSLEARRLRRRRTAHPLLLPLQRKITHFGTTKYPRDKLTIPDESATIKRPFMGDAPRLRRETKIVILRRPHGIFDKPRRRACLSGGTTYITSTFCLGPAGRGARLSSQRAGRG